MHLFIALCVYVIKTVNDIVVSLKIYLRKTYKKLNARLSGQKTRNINYKMLNR